jgi:hypothetical protein
VPEIVAHIGQAGLGELEFYQTIIGLPDDRATTYQIHDGHGEGAFVAISAKNTMRA